MLLLAGIQPIYIMTRPTLKKADVGKRVTVEGYDDVKGTIRFVGKHAKDGTLRVGVELDTPVGKNNGTVKVMTPPPAGPAHPLCSCLVYVPIKKKA